MDAIPQAWIDQVTFHGRVLEKIVSPLQTEQWLVRPGQGASHAHWILGHLVHCRRILCKAVGLDIPFDPWQEAFGKGSTPGDRLDPSPNDLLLDFAEAGVELTARLPELSADDLDADIGRTFANGAHTLGGQILFMLHFHEPYHIGQLGLIARELGHPGLA